MSGLKEIKDYVKKQNCKEDVLEWCDSVLKNYLKRNNPPLQEIEHIFGYVVDLLELKGMKVRDNEMKNLGYFVPDFLEYVQNDNLFRNRYLRHGQEVIYSDEIVVFDDFHDVENYKGDKLVCYKGDIFVKDWE